MKRSSGSILNPYGITCLIQIKPLNSFQTWHFFLLRVMNVKTTRVHLIYVFILLLLYTNQIYRHRRDYNLLYPRMYIVQSELTRSDHRFSIRNSFPPSCWYHFRQLTGYYLYLDIHSIPYTRTRFGMDLCWEFEKMPFIRYEKNQFRNVIIHP